jgi:hypothetical protein
MSKSSGDSVSIPSPDTPLAARSDLVFHRLRKLAFHAILEI